MNFEEQAVVFSCGDARLIAIISSPAQPSHRGVLIVVGGSQYRAGSHRQFTLLCRALAERGIAAMRFDYRGMGDSEGEMRTFEDVRPDIRAAVDQFCVQVPGLREVAIWGLCDAASAALFYAHQDSRITGLVLLNSLGTHVNRYREDTAQALLLVTLHRQGILAQGGAR